MPKGTSWAKVTLNSEEIKSMALAIVELPWHQADRQLINQLVSYY